MSTGHLKKPLKVVSEISCGTSRAEGGTSHIWSKTAQAANSFVSPNSALCVQQAFRCLCVGVSILEQCDRSTEDILNALVAVKFRAPFLRVLRSVGCKFLTDVTKQPTHFIFSVQALQEMFRSFR